MRMRLPLVLAAIAALLGAPSPASAAGNTLHSPSASPRSGDVTTVFTLHVTYDGKFPATAVNATVAGLTLPMARTTGTALQGRWSVSTLLPAGTWVPTFSASAERGNVANVSGPVISVSGPVVPTATPAPTKGSALPSDGTDADQDPGDAQDPGRVDPVTAPADGSPQTGESAHAEPAVASPPNSSHGTGAGTTAPAPNGTPPPGGSAGAPSASGSSTGDDGGGATGPGSAPGGAAESDASDDSAAAPVAASVSGEPATGLVDEGPLPFVLLVGLSGLVAVGASGAALLIRRRRAPEQAPIAAPARTVTDALLDRRTVRRAGVRLADDPIVAAIGVDEQVAARRQRQRRSPVGRGAAERPSGRR